MSDLSVILPPGRQRELAATRALDDLDAEIDRLREALTNANADPDLRPALDQLDLFVRTADQVLASHGDGVDQRLVDDLAILAGTLELAELPSRDPEFGFTRGLTEVRGAQGQITLTLGRALRAARELGLRPSRPALADALAAEVPRALFDGQLAGIARQLDAVVERLDALDVVQRDTPASREADMLVFYLSAMRVEANLARLALKLGETTIDFAALARAAEAMATLTGDFLATLRAWAERASAAIRAGVEGVRGTVRLVATGVRDAARFVARRAARQEPRAEPPPPPAPQTAPPADDAAPPPEFSVEAVHKLILAGRQVPAAWVPFVTGLDFAGTDLVDLTPLAGLLALRSLGLGRRYADGKELPPTKVRDVAPLAGLTALQRLNLQDTQVSDVSPLAGLTALEHLDITETQVRDVSALRQPGLHIVGGPSATEPTAGLLGGFLRARRKGA